MEAHGVVKFLGEGAGKVQALKGVSLSLHRGELALLMGPSGSGKTTLLSVLGCILSPSGESFAFAARRRRICARSNSPNCGAIISASSSSPIICFRRSPPWTMSVWRSTCAASVPAKRSSAPRTRWPASAWRTKSMRFRASSAAANNSASPSRAPWSGDAAAILADEPTAALDGENGHSIMTMLFEIAKDPAHGVLVVTHDPRILPFASRIIRIEDGLIVGEEAGVGAARTPVAKARSVAKQ